MPTTTVKDLASASLGAALATVYTAPASTSAVLRSATFTNATAAVVLLTVTLSPRTAASARTLISARPIAVNETYVGYELLNKVVEPGGVIQASGLALQVDIAGAEVVG